MIAKFSYFQCYKLYNYEDENIGSVLTLTVKMERIEVISASLNVCTAKVSL